MLKYILSSAFLMLMLFSTSCKKKGSSFWFTGMEVVDTNGKEVKWVGKQDNDWQINKYTLSSQQLGLLDIEINSFPNWGQTMVSQVSVSPGVCPMGIDTGVTSYYGFFASADSACVITYTLADEKMNTLAKGNSFIPAGGRIFIPVAIPTSYLKAGTVYRVYYGFSAQLSKFFATGWGDVGACSETNGRTGNCF